MVSGVVPRGWPSIVTAAPGGRDSISRLPVAAAARGRTLGAAGPEPRRQRDGARSPQRQPVPASLQPSATAWQRSAPRAAVPKCTRVARRSPCANQARGRGGQAASPRGPRRQLQRWHRWASNARAAGRHSQPRPAPARLLPAPWSQKPPVPSTPAEAGAGRGQAKRPPRYPASPVRSPRSHPLHPMHLTHPLHLTHPMHPHVHPPPALTAAPSVAPYSRPRSRPPCRRGTQSPACRRQTARASWPARTPRLAATT